MSQKNHTLLSSPCLCFARITVEGKHVKVIMIDRSDKRNMLLVRQQPTYDDMHAQACQVSCSLKPHSSGTPSHYGNPSLLLR